MAKRNNKFHNWKRNKRQKLLNSVIQMLVIYSTFVIKISIFLRERNILILLVKILKKKLSFCQKIVVIKSAIVLFQLMIKCTNSIDFGQSRTIIYKIIY
jgi:hypothetical protein